MGELVESRKLHVNPAIFILFTLTGLVTSTAFYVIQKSEKANREVTAMFAREEEEDGNPRIVWERPLQHWEALNQVPVELIGRTKGELASCLTMMENSINYGQRAKLQLMTDTLPTMEDLETLYAGMLLEGFHTTKPTARLIEGIPATEMVIRKGSPVWTAIIPLLSTAIIGGLIVFGITRLESITKALMPILLVTIGGVIVIAGVASRGPVGVAAGEYIGKRTLKALPRTIPVESKKALAVR
jgi:hypothetical protein